MVEFIVRGGPVMIPLLFCSVIAVAVTLERLWYLLRSRVDSEDLMEDVKLSLGQGKMLEAMQVAKKSKGPVASVLAAGIAYYDNDKDQIKGRIEEVGREEIYKMEKRMGILDTIVNISPLLGLLGTVTGIIKSFNVMAALDGIDQPAALSTGIAEALITTATGLMIAIPTLAIYSYLNSLIDKTAADMSKRSHELVDILGSKGEY